MTESTAGLSFEIICHLHLPSTAPLEHPHSNTASPHFTIENQSQKSFYSVNTVQNNYFKVFCITSFNSWYENIC